MHIDIVTPSDADYPSLLREIPDPPQQLYIRGNRALLTHPHPLAIVGSRKATSYGRTVVASSVAEFAQAQCTIVSGLAFGIDAAAHMAALDNSCYTIAVLPSPVNDSQIMPSSHKRLAQRILDSGGLLISEYANGTVTYASNYHERNRIIAGLCLATIVIEGSYKSGALITARKAVEYNRDLFALPGHITAPLSAAPNKLLRNGAIPFLGAHSVFEHLEHRLTASHPLITTEPTIQLSPIENQIHVLFMNEPLTMDSAIEQVPSLQPHVVIQHAMSLVVKGALTETQPGYYIATA